MSILSLIVRLILNGENASSISFVPTEIFVISDVNPEGKTLILSPTLTSFGKFGDDYIRISFANSEENLSLAIDRLSSMIKDLR